MDDKNGTYGLKVGHTVNLIKAPVFVSGRSQILLYAL